MHFTSFTFLCAFSRAGHVNSLLSFSSQANYLEYITQSYEFSTITATKSMGFSLINTNIYETSRRKFLRTALLTTTKGYNSKGGDTESSWTAGVSSSKKKSNKNRSSKDFIEINDETLSIQTAQEILSAILSHTKSSKNRNNLLDLETCFYDSTTGLVSEGVWHNAMMGIASICLNQESQKKGVNTNSNEVPLKIAESLLKFSWDGISFRRRAWSGIWDHSNLLSDNTNQKPPEQAEYYQESIEHRCVSHGIATVFWNLLCEDSRGTLIESQIKQEAEMITTQFIQQFWDARTGFFRTVSLEQGGGTLDRPSSSSGNISLKDRDKKADSYYRAVDQAIGILACLSVLQCYSQKNVDQHLVKSSPIISEDRLIEIIDMAMSNLLSPKGFGYNITKGDDNVQLPRSYINMSRRRNFWHDGWVMIALICATDMISNTNKNQKQLQSIYRSLISRYGHVDDDGKFDGTIMHWGKDEKKKVDNVRYCGDNALFHAMTRLLNLPDQKESNASFWSFVESIRGNDKLASVGDVYSQVRLHPNTELTALLLWPIQKK